MSMDISIKDFGSWLMVALLSVASLAAAGNDLRLVDAVKNRDKAAARSLLKQHAEVNAAEADGTTAVAWAAHWDDLETADLLIRAGANVNAANDYGVTPLWLACTNGNAAMVENLLKAGANPNAALARTGATPLMRCARTGNVAAVKSIVLHEARVNTQETWRGQNALMWAVAAKHPDAVKALIEHGADVHARSKSGFTPLLFAAQQGDVDTARILLAAGADVNEATPQDGSALVVASASGHEAFAIFLLEKGADPNAADAYGITALHYTVQKGLAPAAGLEYNRSFRPPPPSMPELAKALLAHGANPNAKIVKDFPTHSRSPLFERMSLAGATPFLLAAISQDAGIMRALAAKGADPQLAAKGNITPLMAAAGVVWGPDEELTEQQEKNALEAVKVAVELGGDINATNKNGRTALHGAAYMGANSIIQFLVEKGAKIDAKDKVGQTPWGIAEGIVPENANGDDGSVVHKASADLLLKLGASPQNAPAARTDSGTGKTKAAKTYKTKE
jgi:ankyrin repeat protein